MGFERRMIAKEKVVSEREIGEKVRKREAANVRGTTNEGERKIKRDRVN